MLVGLYGYDQHAFLVFEVRSRILELSYYPTNHG